nr:hypothetical protein [Tanacetum cinerariifolium]
MATTIEQQVALDEALVPSTQRLRIGRRNLRLPSNIQSRESTLQLVYDVLFRCPFFKAFLMNNKNHIVDLESFKEMLHICPRIPGQAFAELPFEEEILEFIRLLGHGANISTLTDININKLYQPWRSFAAIINKCLTGKSSGYDSLWPSQAQILNTKADKEYYACATGEAAPKLKASARRKKSGKQPAKAKSPSDPSEMKELVQKQGFLMYPLMNKKKNFHGTLLMIKESEEVDEEGDGEEDQGVRISEEERLNEEEEAEKLYRDVNINQGRGIQATLDVEDSHMTLTLVHPNGQQQSSSVSSHFMTSMLNPPSDVGMESIFMTASSLVAPLQTSTPIMTPSTNSIITTISHAPIPPTTIPSEVLQNLPTFDSVFRFEDRLKSLEANFSEYIQTNPFAEAVSNILGIVHHYMNPRMTEAVRVAVQIQTNRLYDSYQRENDEFLQTINENMKRIIKEQDEGPFTGSNRGSKRRREGKEPELASAPLETTTRSAGRSTTGSKSRQVSAGESAFVEEPVQTISQIDEPSYLVFETDFSNFIINQLRVDTLTLELLAGPSIELMKGSYTSLIELEYHLEEVYKATMD